MCVDYIIMHKSRKMVCNRESKNNSSVNSSKNQVNSKIKIDKPFFNIFS